ncbi:MAG: hypothetical protein MZV70_71335 [Desulfobacterales bacterium]|nr:hypothetical protein [Desulfobacterales bacterium]
MIGLFVWLEHAACWRRTRPWKTSSASASIRSSSSNMPAVLLPGHVLVSGVFRATSTTAAGLGVAVIFVHGADDAGQLADLPPAARAGRAGLGRRCRTST